MENVVDIEDLLLPDMLVTRNIPKDANPKKYSIEVFGNKYEFTSNSKSFLIGGDISSGKTTLAIKLANFFSKSNPMLLYVVPKLDNISNVVSETYTGSENNFRFIEMWSIGQYRRLFGTISQNDDIVVIIDDTCFMDPKIQRQIMTTFFSYYAECFLKKNIFITTTNFNSKDEIGTLSYYKKDFDAIFETKYHQGMGL